MKREIKEEWKLWVSIAMKKDDDFVELTERARMAAGVAEDGAGVGMGQRDVDFTFSTRGAAMRAGKRVEEEFRKTNVVEWSVNKEDEEGEGGE